MTKAEEIFSNFSEKPIATDHTEKQRYFPLCFLSVYSVADILFINSSKCPKHPFFLKFAIIYALLINRQTRPHRIKTHDNHRFLITAAKS